MDYIYGVINEKAAKSVYSGGLTDTAAVNVDNSEGKIYVNCFLTQSAVRNLINSSIQTLNYEDTEQEDYVVTAVNENNGVIEVTKKPLSQVIPPAPTEDGVYTLQVTVLNGVTTYSWIAQK